MPSYVIDFRIYVRTVRQGAYVPRYIYALFICYFPAHFSPQRRGGSAHDDMPPHAALRQVQLLIFQRGLGS